MGEYYIDKTLGDDSGLGTIGDPWEYFPGMSGYTGSHTPTGDDFFYGKKGEVWRDTFVVSASGTSGHPITFGAYGTGNKPSIRGSDLKNTAGLWTQEGATSYTQEWADGFEDEGASWTSLTNSPVFSSDAKRSGSLGLDNSNASKYCTKTFTAASEKYARLYMYFNTLGLSGSEQFIPVYFYNGANPQWEFQVKYNVDQIKWRSYVDVVDSGVYATTGPTTGQWYEVELHWKASSGSNDGIASVKVDGTEVITFENHNNTNNVDRVHVGVFSTTAASLDFYIDDFEYGTGNWPSAGEAANYWYLSSISNDPGVFVHDGSLGTKKTLKGDLGTQWDYWFDSGNSRLYVYSTSNPTSLATNLEIAIREFTIGAQGEDYTTFDNLDIRHAYSELWCGWGATNVIFQNCDFSQSPGNILQFHNGSNNGLVDTCTFQDWGLGSGTGAYAVHVIGYSGTETGPVSIRDCTMTQSVTALISDHSAVMCDNDGWIQTFSGNTIIGNSAKIDNEGIVIYQPGSGATDITISGNTIEDVGGIGIVLHGLEANGATPTVEIKQNWIENTCLDDGIDAEAIRCRNFTSSSDVTISYNIINGTYDGVYAHHGIKVAGADAVKIYNNTIYDADDGLHVQAFSADNSINLDVRNNAFVSNRMWGAQFEANQTAATFDYNGYYDNSSGDVTGITKGDNAVSSNPLMANPGSGDFRLQLSSPYRDEGDNSVWSGQADIVDYAGNPITNGVGTIVAPGGVVDIGAIEGYPTYERSIAGVFGWQGRSGG